ncbi:MAG: VOC family protein [Defluviitaleaceae bacterium]|nr:VOC family protein [Defluviitaleaceae bacterium]MCL2836223.1 VOC family protein [Defluviitaleaceae bacterium]
MLIPILHFCGDCEDAIRFYENAFATKAENVEYRDDNKIVHAEMIIRGQRIFLNDRFGNKNKTLDCAMHMIITFNDVDELLECYGNLKEGGSIIDPFRETPYSPLVGNFMDKFGVLWGFMAVSQ